MTEADLAALVIEWLPTQGWPAGGIAQEFKTEDGRRIDIVATRGPRVYAIEAKLRLGFPVMAQALKNIPLSHLSSVAVVMPSSPRIVSEAIECFGACGLGIIGWTPEKGVHAALDPMVRRPDPHASISRDIREEHRSGEYASAGTPGGSHFSPFAGFKRSVLAYVGVHPACSLSDIVQNHPDRFQEGRSPAVAERNLLNLIQRGALGLETRGTGRNRRVYVEGSASRMPGK